MMYRNSALLLSLILPLSAGAQVPGNPRERALAAQAQIYGDEHPFPRNFQRQLSNFRDLPEVVIAEEPQSLQADTLAQGALSAVELWYAGHRVRLAYAQPVSVNGKSYSLLRGAGVTFLMIDGLARAVLTIHEKDATISPILTYSMIQAGLVVPPNEGPDYSATWIRERMGPFGTWYEMGLGGLETFLGIGLVRGKANFGVSPRRARNLRVMGALVLVDGAARFQAGLQHQDPGALAIDDFVRRVGANQPVYGNLSLGDLTEDGLRRLGWID